MAKAVHPGSAANIDIQIQRWPIERLKPDEGNARTHSNAQINQIAASMKEFGWTNPILVDADDGVIAGQPRRRKRDPIRRRQNRWRAFAHPYITGAVEYRSTVRFNPHDRFPDRL